MHISIANFSQMVTGQTLLLAINEYWHTAFPLVYLHLTLVCSKGQVMYYPAVNSSQTVTDMANIANK